MLILSRTKKFRTCVPEYQITKNKVSAAMVLAKAVYHVTNNIRAEECTIDLIVCSILISPVRTKPKDFLRQFNSNLKHQIPKTR